MAAYTYKQVTHRDDYLAAIPLWQEQSGRESNEDPGYDGDCWLVTEFLLDQKDATLTRVTAERDRLRLALGHNEDVAACAEFHELAKALEAIRRVSADALRREVADA